VILKTKNFKETLKRDYNRIKHAINTFLNAIWKSTQFKKCEAIFENFKLKFCNILTFAYLDFIKIFILYVNRSKKREYGTALYQINNDNIVKSILFISKIFSGAEKRCWLTELEITAPI
jgi:hypothetical protein